MRARIIESLKRLWKSGQITTDDQIRLVLADISTEELASIKE